MKVPSRSAGRSDRHHGKIEPSQRRPRRCDREGQLIGQEILEHHEYRGEVMRVLFTAQDQKTIHDAFGRAKSTQRGCR